MEHIVYENTNKEIWRKPSDKEDVYGDTAYEPSIHITQDNKVGIEVGGTVYQKDIEEWHRLAGGKLTIRDFEISDKKPKILVNQIMTPDGTILQSHHRHDYRVYEDEEGRESSVDGGTDYLRRVGEYTEMSIYENDKFEVIRRFLCRGGRGKDGKEKLKYIPLFMMSNSWLKSCIEYSPNNYYNKWYQMELDYREQNNIEINEK